MGLFVLFCRDRAVNDDEALVGALPAVSCR